MNEMIVNVTSTPGQIDFNLSELKAALAVEMDRYNGLIVTGDTVKESKKDLATLRKMRKELNDRKIAVKKSFMEPYDRFETEVKEALGMIDKPIALIDEQVKEFETAEKKAKQEHCMELLKECAGEYADYIKFESVFRDAWLNKTTTDADIKEDISVRKIQVENDINTIKALGSEIEEKLLEKYKQTGQLADAVRFNTDYMDAKKMTEKTVTVPVTETIDVTVKTEDVARFEIYGKENIESVRFFLGMNEIDYKEV